MSESLVPQPRPSWKQGCLIALAGLLLSGTGFFVCLSVKQDFSDSMAIAFVAIFFLGLLIFLGGCVLALVRAVRSR